MKKKTVIVADSSANLFQADCADFMPVPLKILTDEKEYVDGEALNVASMLADLREYKGRSGTSCPSVGDWLQAFGDAEEVYGVSLTSHLSGCYNAACIAAEEYMTKHPGRKVFILDSLSTGPELELLIEKYWELIETGCTFEKIRERIAEYLKQTHLLFSLRNIRRVWGSTPTLSVPTGLVSVPPTAWDSSRDMAG